jgi:hypothetical protein
VLSKDELAVLRGTLLGDGMIDSAGRLVVVHGRRQSNYLEWKRAVFSGLQPVVVDHRGGFGTIARRLRTWAHPMLSEWRRRWYVAGRKAVPEEIWRQLDPLTLAVWLMYDGWGCRGIWAGVSYGLVSGPPRWLAWRRWVLKLA